ncbi:MAG: type II toxin-antitoxin system RelE/ParE family toxin [Alphaproteobacteria bacterium]|nr:type II toxin-antitoxin system RelE/ParE family toxin [Alphaproteobacteria bacterium]
MATRVFWTSAAARDLARVQEWLTQPGSGQRAHRIIRRIKSATDALATTAHRYAVDPGRPANRRIIIAEHVVSFRLVIQDSDTLIFIERVRGPGQTGS